MSGDAWLTLAVVVATITLLALERFPPPIVMLGSVVVLLVTGVVDEDRAFSGFSNEAPFIVAALYVVAGAAEATGALERLTQWILGGNGSGPRATDGGRRELARIVGPTTAASGLVPNTPLVALLAPRVVAWSRRSGRSASRYLMPLSHAAVFGGVITVLGTSANITVSGLLRESGQEPLGIFEITPVGLPLAILGAALIIIVTPRLLPQRLSPTEADTETAREFTLEMEVTGNTLAGRTVADAGLRNLEGVFLLELERDGLTTAPVAPDHVLATGDRLTFAGAVSRVLDLQRTPGLASAEQRHFSVVGSSNRMTYEVVVGEGSPLAGRTLKDIGFRGRYGGAVFAIHRSGERVGGKLGEVRLRVGDLLLVLADPEFRDRWQDTHDFLVVSPLDGGVPVRREHAVAVELTLLAMVVAAGTGLLDLLEASLLAAGVLVAGRVVSLAEARRAINFDVILMIATSFGLGAAMAESGLAAEIGKLLVRSSESAGDVGVLAAVLLGTMILTELLSNNAAAVLMFPIAMASAADAGLDPRPLAIAILIGASCSFLTPIGYQTNLLVYGMGGYRFLDFTRVGAPLTLLTIAVSLVAIPIAFPLSG